MLPTHPWGIHPIAIARQPQSSPDRTRADTSHTSPDPTHLPVSDPGPKGGQERGGEPHRGGWWCRRWPLCIEWCCKWVTFCDILFFCWNNNASTWGDDDEIFGSLLVARRSVVVAAWIVSDPRKFVEKQQLQACQPPNTIRSNTHGVRIRGPWCMD
jgi:hypothetical protein